MAKYFMSEGNAQLSLSTSSRSGSRVRAHQTQCAAAGWVGLLFTSSPALPACPGDSALGKPRQREEKQSPGKVSRHRAWLP